MATLAVFVAIGAFIILGIMFALLGASGRKDARLDPITQQIIIRASTGPVEVNAPVIRTEGDDQKDA